MKKVQPIKTKTLLIDMLPVKLVLNESEGEKAIARGEFMRCDVMTENNRIYPSKVIQREIMRLQEDIKNRRVFGELDHPEDGKTRLSRVSHIITDLRMEGNIVYGTAEILDTEAGLNLKAILQAGGEVGVSSRGFGTVNEEGVVNDDYQLITFDFVALPAIKSAYPKFFMEDLNMDIKELKEKNPELYEQIKAEVKEEVEKELELEKEKRKKEEEELEKEKEELEKAKESEEESILDRPIEEVATELSISMDDLNILKLGGVKTLKDLTNLSVQDLLSEKYNLSSKVVKKIENRLKKWNLSLRKEISDEA
jgi:hypothetical protein